MKTAKCKHCGKECPVGSALEPGTINGVEYLVDKPMIICCGEKQLVSQKDTPSKVGD